MGLDFREAALLLNSKNSHIFVPNMVFSLAVGFHNVPLGSADKIDAAGSVRKLSKYSMLVADTVIIRVYSSVWFLKPQLMGIYIILMVIGGWRTTRIVNQVFS